MPLLRYAYRAGGEDEEEAQGVDGIQVGGQGQSLVERHCSSVKVESTISGHAVWILPGSRWQRCCWPGNR